MADVPLRWWWILSLVVMFFTGAVGDYLYKKRFENSFKRLEKGIETRKSDAKFATRDLARSGGTNFWAVIIFVIVQSVAGIIPKILTPEKYNALTQSIAEVVNKDDASPAATRPPSVPDELKLTSKPSIAQSKEKDKGATGNAGDAGDTDVDISTLKKLAQEGDADAQNNLGVRYLDGISVEKNIDEGVKWLQKAVDEGQRDAENTLGALYAQGIGVEQDPNKALALISKSAEQGNPNAEDNLGQMYLNGIGVQQDRDAAIQWYTKAANHGSKEGANHLAQLR